MSNRGRINGRDFVPSRKHSREHFSTDSTARKRNGLRDGSAVARSAGSWNFFLRICNVWPVTGHSYM